MPVQVLEFGCAVVPEPPAVCVCAPQSGQGCLGCLDVFGSNALFPGQLAGVFRVQWKGVRRQAVTVLVAHTCMPACCACAVFLCCSEWHEMVINNLM